MFSISKRWPLAGWPSSTSVQCGSMMLGPVLTQIKGWIGTFTSWIPKFEVHEAIAVCCMIPKVCAVSFSEAGPSHEYGRPLRQLLTYGGKVMWRGGHVPVRSCGREVMCQ